jgi:phenylalanyl-tRNA synthetase alpha chain
MTDTKKLVSTLSSIERKILPYLEKITDFKKLIEVTGLMEVQVSRGLQWLMNKGIIRVEIQIKEIVDLDVNGKKYLKTGLPEKRLLKAIENGPLTLEQVRKRADLSKEELNVALGVLRRRAAIFITKEKDLVIKILDLGKNMLHKESLEEKFLKRDFPCRFDDLLPEEKYSLKELKTRKSIVKATPEKIKTIVLSDLGKEILRQSTSWEDSSEYVTPEMIKQQSWKAKEFRRYDIRSSTPSIYGARRHFVNESLLYAKRIWTNMGFKEMKGPIVNTSFWDFDVLFTAQDHSVREMQDTFFLKDPAKGQLPDKKLVQTVAKIHSDGGNTKSRGWGYEWDPEEARKNVLRTHTTVLSAHTLAALKKEDWPAKYFAVGRCFRNESLDWKHLFEFNQTEGIVVDPDANFRHLIGYLKQFFTAMGFPQARFRPSYFPYTEPSIEIDVFHPVHKQWIELGGAGIFRPEVTVALLGEEVPVLAWGPGFDRIVTDYYRIKDIRDLYKNDLKQMKELRYWMR